jgi:hypothetical protein
VSTSCPHDKGARLRGSEWHIGRANRGSSLLCRLKEGHSRLAEETGMVPLIFFGGVLAMHGLLRTDGLGLAVGVGQTVYV